MSFRTRGSRWGFAACAVLLLFAAVPARAAEAPAAATDGLVVAIDPQTGALRAPTAEEIAALARPAALRSIAPPLEAVVQLRADGILSAQVPEDYMEYALLAFGPDGRPVASCVTGPDAAARTLARLAALPAAAPALETE